MEGEILGVRFREETSDDCAVAVRLLAARTKKTPDPPDLPISCGIPRDSPQPWGQRETRSALATPAAPGIRGERIVGEAAPCGGRADPRTASVARP